MSPSSSSSLTVSSDRNSSLDTNEGGGTMSDDGDIRDDGDGDIDDIIDELIPPPPPASRRKRLHEKCPVSGADVVLCPLERAPENVFSFTKTRTSEKTDVVVNATSTITTITKVVSTSRGWRNVFTLPISYDVNMVMHGTLFDVRNTQLLDSTGVHPEGYHTRFAVVDRAVHDLYGDRIAGYFASWGISLTTCVIDGGEADKRSKVREQ
jgi:hypothetical protein